MTILIKNLNNKTLHFITRPSKMHENDSNCNESNKNTFVQVRSVASR